MKLNIEQKVDGNGKFWYEIFKEKKGWFFTKKRYYSQFETCNGLISGFEYEFYDDIMRSYFGEPLRFETLEEVHKKAKEIIIKELSQQVQVVTINEFGVENL